VWGGGGGVVGVVVWGVGGSPHPHNPNPPIPNPQSPIPIFL